MFFRRLLVAAFLLIFTATAASAYTVVMRNGRRVEIPNTFTLTKSTLTYETAPGIQITIQLSNIDVAATERVNGQSLRSFFTTATEAAVVAPAVQTPRSRAARSITNRDLEAYRRARMESEKERDDLGLPSVEQRRRETEEIEDRTQEQIRNMRAREELDFWRNRATQLETQIAANQAAQMSMMRNQINDGPWAYPYGVGLVTTGFPFAFDGFGGFGRFNRFGFRGIHGFKNFNFHRGRLLFTTPRSIPNRGFGRR